MEIGSGVSGRFGGINSNILSYTHLYSRILPALNKKWKMNLDEGDDEIITGRYLPKQFRTPESLSNPRTLKKADNFELQFVNQSHQHLIEEIIQKTKLALDKVNKYFNCKKYMFP